MERDPITGPAIYRTSDQYKLFCEVGSKYRNVKRSDYGVATKIYFVLTSLPALRLTVSIANGLRHLSIRVSRALALPIIKLLRS